MTGKSVTGGKGENPEKTTWHTHKHDLVCVTCDCRLINWAATYGEVIGCCQSDIACFNKFSSFYHMLCDVASIFSVRTYVVSQAFTMVLAGSVIKPHCCLASRQQLVLRVCVLSSF